MHKRSDAYSSLLSKPQLLSMTWRTFKILLPAWQSGSKQNLIGGFQKGRTCSCISRDTKVAGCQTFFIFQKLHFSSTYHIVIWKQCHLWTLLIFSSTKIWQPVTLQSLEVQGHVVPFWKPPINVNLEPGYQGCCPTWNVDQGLLKNGVLLHRLL